MNLILWMYGLGMVNVASGEPVLLLLLLLKKTPSVRMPGDCTVTHSEGTTHLGLRGDLKLPCLLIPFQPHLMLFAAHPIVPLSVVLQRASSNHRSDPMSAHMMGHVERMTQV